MRVRLPILCYHKVGPVAQEGRRLNVEPGRLRSHLLFFMRRAYAFPTVWEVAEGRWEARSVLFTFDDAYASTIQNAAPLFLAAGRPCAIFAVAGHVGTESSWDGSLARPLADWDSLRSAGLAGIEIGCHSLSHARIDTLDASSLEREIQGAKRVLEEHGIVHASFCYPYGSHSEAVRSAVRKSGYRVAFALGKRCAHPHDDRLALPRIAVAYSDVLPKLIYKMFVRPMLP